MTAKKFIGDNSVPELTRAAVVVLPVLASSIAFTYDVGFFSGLNIEFFTFFTISEHLVFALQALPFAVGPAIWVLSMYATVFLGDQYFARLNEKELADFRNLDAPAQAAKLGKLQSQSRVVRFVDPFVQLLFIGLAVWLLFQKAYLGATTVAVSIVLNYAFARREQRSEWSYLFAVVSACIPFVLSFVVGFDLAQRLQRTEAPSFIITVGMQDIPGVVVRAGDRGILFYSIEKKKVLLIRWDTIKRLEGAVLQM